MTTEGPTARRDAAEEAARLLSRLPFRPEHQQPQERDPIKEIEDAHWRGKRLRAFEDGAGITDRATMPIQKQEEKMTINLADIMRAQNDITRVAIEALQDIKKTPGQESNPYLTHLEGELREVKGLLAAQTVDPMKQVIDVAEHMDKIAEVMKKHLGAPEGVRVSGADMSSLIELEKMKVERDVSARRWAEEMDERRHERTLEQRKWEEDQNFRWAEFREKRQSRDKLTTELSDLAGAVMDGLGGGGEGISIAKKAVFDCPKCGEKIAVKVGTPKIACPTCREIHELEWGDKKQQATPPAKERPQEPVQPAEEE